MEYFDILDSKGEPLGYTESREKSHKLGLWHATIHLWIVNDSEQVLLQQRHWNKQTDPGCWDISVAGHIEAGQTPMEACLRETQEEIGAVLIETEIEFIATLPHQSPIQNLQQTDNEFQHIFICRKNLEISELTPQPSEVLELKWMDLKEYFHELDIQNPQFVNHPLELQVIKNIFAHH
jgi:isopentenyl-diphosphate delta-isomerase